MTGDLARLTRSHKAEQVKLAQASGLAEMVLTFQLIAGEISPPEFVARAVAINRLGHGNAVRKAQDYLRLARGIYAPLLSNAVLEAPAFDYAGATARAMSTVRAAERLPMLGADPGGLDATAKAARRRVAGTLRRWTVKDVHDAHADTLIRSAQSVGSGWRVVTDGSPCAFCAMLASYGEDINGASEWPDHHFHPDCGCTIEEVPLGVEPELSELETKFVELRELAEREADQHPDRYHGSTKRQRLMSAMRANGQGVINDASEGSSSGRKLLKQIRDLELSGAVKRKECRQLPRKLTSEEITRHVGRPDLTDGSCGSVAYAYAGNRAGLDVHDFRGGESQRFFATAGNTAAVSKLKGVLSWSEDTRNEITGVTKLLNNMEKEKEYILGVTRHAAVIKKTRNGGIRYLELQADGAANGWKKLDIPTLMNRFGAVADSFAAFGADRYGRVDIISVESLEKSKEFLSLLPYINT